MSENWILAVDDSNDDAELVYRAMTKGGRTEKLEIRYDCESALQLLGEQPRPPSLILLDGRLPGMTSTEFLVQVRSNLRFKLVPIVLLSASDHQRSIEEALSSGANSYVCKATEYAQTMLDLASVLGYWLDVHCDPLSPRFAFPSGL